MGARHSKVSESEQQPQLYAVATPHPTLQYIYPVYAAPVDVPSSPGKQGRRSPLAWRSERSKSKKEMQYVAAKDIPIVAEPEESIHGYSAVTGANEDGTWYHFHVDATGAVDYIRPGTTLPNTFAEPLYVPHSPGQAMAPSMAMAGVAYEESYYSYPTSSPYHGYYHPQPQRVSQHSMGSFYPRPRSASPVQSRSMTPTNMKPRRSTTPNPRMTMVSAYDPTPPVPQYIDPAAARRHGTPFPRATKALPPPESTRDIEKFEYRSRSSTVPAPTSNRTSRHTHTRSVEEETTVISSHLREKTSTTLKAISSRPYSPESAQDMQVASTNRFISPKQARYYPSPSTPGSQPSLRA